MRSKQYISRYVKGIDVVMPMSNLIEYRNNYLKTSESLWQYYR